MPSSPDRDLSNSSIHQTELGNVSDRNIAEISCTPLCPMARLPPLTGIYVSGCPVHDIPPNFVVGGDGLDFWTGIVQSADGTAVVVVGETSTTEPTALLRLAPRGTIITLSVLSSEIPPESPNLSRSRGSPPPPPPPSPIFSGSQSRTSTSSPDLLSFALASPTPRAHRAHPVSQSPTPLRIAPSVGEANILASPETPTHWHACLFDYVSPSDTGDDTPLGIALPIGEANVLRTPETPTPSRVGNPRLFDCATPSDMGDDGDDDGAMRRTGIPFPLSSISRSPQDSSDDDESLDYDLIHWAHVHSTEYEVFTAEEAINNFDAQTTDWTNRGSLALDDHRLNEAELSEVLEQHAIAMHNRGLRVGTRSRFSADPEFQFSYPTRMD